MKGWPFRWGYVRVAWAFFWLGYSMAPASGPVNGCRALARFARLLFVWWRRGDIGLALDDLEGSVST